MMQAESYGRGGGAKRAAAASRHPADYMGHDDDDEEEEAARPPKRAKVPGPPGPPPAPILRHGPPPCYRWVTGKCLGNTCPVKATKRTGPHLHAWNKRDIGHRSTLRSLPSATSGRTTDVWKRDRRLMMMGSRSLQRTHHVSKAGRRVSD